MPGDYVLEIAGRGDGLWFVAEDPSGDIEVIAPPGVHLVAPRFEPSDRGRRSGWRYARWTGHDALVDIDRPADLDVLTTVDVVDQVGPERAHEVRAILVGMLPEASAFGQCSAGRRISEDWAQAGVMAVSWLLDELREAFPHESWDAPESGLELTPAPDTEEIAAQLALPHWPVRLSATCESASMRLVDVHCTYEPVEPAPAEFSLLRLHRQPSGVLLSVRWFAALLTGRRAPAADELQLPLFSARPVDLPRPRTGPPPAPRPVRRSTAKGR